MCACASVCNVIISSRPSVDVLHGDSSCQESQNVIIMMTIREDGMESESSDTNRSDSK